MAKVKLSNVMGMRAVHVLCSRGVVCLCFLYDRDTGTMIFFIVKVTYILGQFPVGENK